ncbi:MAG TPA: cytochrome c oxidase subunit II [Pyrinomonadaceae bacterium]|nr:cytochrome c oxidase subunit II [Pyrinomonadaceae bacterium]
MIWSNACGGGVHSALNPAGPQATNISKIWWLMFYVSTAIFVIVLASLAVGVIKGYKNQTDELPELEIDEDAKRHRTNIVITAVATTVAILIVFLLYSFFVGRGLTSELAQKNGVVIEVTGHQWWWEVRYDNVDASNIFTTANEIHIPVGVPVTLSLKANDVIHSFWVPNLHGKKDLIPGKISTIWLQADQPGVFRGQCAEYCGLQHAHMALWVIAEPREQFDSWLQAQIQAAMAPSTESAKKGQQIFMSSACVMCHTISGTPAGSNIGPNLTHVASRQTIAAATLENTRDHLAGWVNNSQRIKPGNRMPPMNFSDNDLQPLLDYLQSLK